jgi:CzcA family heavy metal efflux pump
MNPLDGIARWSLARPVLIVLACLWFLVGGAIWVRDTPFELLPDLSPAETTIQTEAPGLAAEQVEALVTQPIETSLIAAPGVGRVRSVSTQGLSTVAVRYASGAEPDRARQAVLERLSALEGALPLGVGAPRLAPPAPPGATVLKIGFTSDTLDPMALRDIVQWTVRPRLLTADGVARVAVYGGAIRRLEVRARPADLSDSDLGFLDVLNAVKRATSVAGAGFIDTDAQRVLIEPHGQTLTAADLGAGQIATAAGAPVRIDDVADVVETPAPAFSDALIGGKPGVLAEVARQYGANAIVTTRAVEDALRLLAPVLAARGVKVTAELDRPATFATWAIRALAGDLAIGAALAAIALLIFVRDPAATLISLIGAPLSLLAAVMTLKAAGWSLNAMTLGGLAIGFGVAIDDSVIGVEAVLARLRDAETRHASRPGAVLAATLQARGPVVYATLALIVALLPILNLRGPQGALLAPLAGVAIATSVASLALASTLTPALCLIFLRHIGPEPDPAILRRAKDWHGAGLGPLCARPWPVVAGAAAAAALAVGALVFYPVELLPSVHDGHLVADLHAPPGLSPAVSRDYGERLSTAVAPLVGVRSVSLRSGRDPTGDDSWGPERSVLDLELAPELGVDAQRRLAGRVLATLRRFPGLGPTVESRFDSASDGTRRSDPIEVRLFGQDLDALDAAAIQVMARVRVLPGVRNARTEVPARAPVVRVDINFQRLALFGLSSADVLDTVQAAFAGERVASLYDNGRVVDLAVSAQTSLRRDPEAVGDLLLRSSSGISAPLKSVANVYLTDDRATIAHEGAMREQVVRADADQPARVADLARKALLTPMALPAGVFAEVRDTGQAAVAARQALLLDYAMALLGVFALLAIAYDASTGALIMASTVFALVGAVAAMAMLGGVLSVGGMIGFVAVFGLSIRGAILLFGRLEDLLVLRREPWSAATVARAARERLTPQLMTTLLVALGLLPIAIHAGAGGREILGPMAVVILGGLVTATLGELFILPPLIVSFWRPRSGRRARAE